MKYGRIILFCDYGVDDAVATLHILRNADMFEHIDIVPIGGNVPVETAYRNAHTLLAAASKNGISGVKKVRVADTRGIRQNHADIPDVHGRDGLGDVLKAAECAVPVVDFKEFCDSVRSSAKAERDCVLSLGPCTVPVMLGYVPFCTVLMGGTTAEKPNYGGYEFNEALDKDAFKQLAYRATAVATLDTCHDKKFEFDAFSAGEPDDSLVKSYAALCRRRGERPVVYDYCAALAVTHPELFDAVRVRREDGVEYNELRLK